MLECAYQVEIAFGSEMGMHVCFFRIWDPSWCRPRQTVHALQTLGTDRCVSSAVFKGPCSLVPSTPSGSSTLSTSSSTGFSEPCSDSMETSHLGLSVPSSLTPRILSGCGSLCLFPFTAGGSALRMSEQGSDLSI